MVTVDLLNEKGVCLSSGFAICKDPVTEANLESAVLSAVSKAKDLEGKGLKLEKAVIKRLVEAAAPEVLEQQVKLGETKNRPREMVVKMFEAQVAPEKQALIDDLCATLGLSSIDITGWTNLQVLTLKQELEAIAKSLEAKS